MTTQSGRIWTNARGQRFWLVSGALPVLLGPGESPPVYTPQVGDTAAGMAFGPGSSGNEGLRTGDSALVETARLSVSAGPSFAMQTPVQGGAMPLEPGADLRDFGGDLGGGDAAMALAAVPVAGAGAMLLSRLLAMLPAALRTGVSAAIKSLGGVGARIGWNRLPPLVQQLLIFSGVTAGVDILIDTGPDDRGIIQLPGTSDLSLGNMGAMGVSIVGSWTANGVKFVKLSDGRLGAQNKRGVWKFWRPKKPIVLFASGAKDINTYLRADAALNRQSKRLKAAISRRVPTARRQPKVVQGQVIAADGVRIVRNG